MYTFTLMIHANVIILSCFTDKLITLSKSNKLSELFTRLLDVNDKSVGSF
jgi:hypothetical protein